MLPGLPSDFWPNENRYLAAVIRPRLLTLAMAGAMDAVRKLQAAGLFVNDDLINADAAQWAMNYTDTLLQQLGTTTQNGVGKILQNWIETPGATMGDLEKQLLPYLDDNQTRAWRVSVTETTRAYAEGNNIAHVRAGVPSALYKPPAHPNCYCTLSVRRLRKANLWVQVWYTNNDEKVCRQSLDTPWGVVSGCRALNGIIVSEGAHLGEHYSGL
jgi:hypothetical protein